MQIEATAERVAKNQATFRAANEGIERFAEELAPEISTVPFICECPNRSCRTVVPVSIADYETVRSQGRWFLVARGHEVTKLDGLEFARVERTHERFTLMEKIGEAGEIAESLDPRDPDRPGG
jgi:hypothetical protein